MWSLTLTFLLVSLMINSAYFGFFEKMAEVAFLERQIKLGDPNDFLPGVPICSYRAICASVLSTISVALNDAFFVSMNQVAVSQSQRYRSPS
jgi:hypothetical protein